MNDLYTIEHKFKKNAGKDTSLTVQFHRADPGNKKGTYKILIWAILYFFNSNASNLKNWLSKIGINFI